MIDILLLLISLLNIPAVYHRPESPFATSSDNRQLIISEIRNISSAGDLQIGDMIIKWNNQTPRLPEGIEFLADLSQIGNSVTVTYQRNGNIIKTTIKLIPYYSSPRYVIIIILVGFIAWCLGVFMLIKGPSTVGSNTLQWTMVAFGITIMTTSGALDSSGILSHLTESVLYCSYMFTICGFYFFSTVFPVERGGAIWSRYVFVYGPMTLLTLIMTGYRLHAMYHQSLESFAIYQSLLDIFHLTIYFFIGGALFHFIRALRVSKSEDERLQVKWILWGVTIAASPFLFFYILPQFMNIAHFVGEDYTTIFFLAIPLSFSIAIVRFRILDIDFLINRTIVYSIMTLFIGSLYLLAVVMTLSAIGGEAIFEEYLYFLLITLFVTVLFNPIRKRLQDIIDQYIFSARYKYSEVISDLTTHINKTFVSQEIPGIFIKMIDNYIPNGGIAFYALHENNLHLKAFQGKFDKNVITLSINDISGFQDANIFALDGSVERTSHDISFEKLKFLSSLNTDLAIPIKIDIQTLYGVFLIRLHYHKDRFIAAEIKLLKQAAILITQQIDRLMTQEKFIIEHTENERLKELNKLKSFFVSSVTHELKTPLSNIKMHAELLQTLGKIDEISRQEHFDIIRGESNRLHRMIDNVLNISKIERNAMNYRFREIDLTEIIETVMHIMKYMLDQHNFELELDISSKMILINGDEDAIKQVLLNLITNSIKYSGEEKYLAISTSQKNGFALILITDHGIGIDEKVKDHVFEAFYRGSDDKIENIGGAGIGLAIVSHVMTAHKGRVQIDSKPGAGTSVSLYFPILNSPGIR